jgi:hypothetical protein
MMHRYPFGLHGYHRPGKGGKVRIEDPLNVYGGTYDPNEKSRIASEEDEARKKALRDQIDKLYGIGDPNAAARMKGDESQVSEATSSYYGDQLARAAAAAERNNRFNLARQGLSGGSQDASSNAELQTDQALGATRIDQAARAAAASLAAQRENERLSANALVNAGAGTRAVDSAQEGLKSSLNNANNQQRTDLTSDLFTGFADNYAMQNANSANAALLARYQQQLGAFFPTKSAGGTVTPSG